MRKIFFLTALLTMLFTAVAFAEEAPAEETAPEVEDKPPRERFDLAKVGFFIFICVIPKKMRNFVVSKQD